MSSANAAGGAGATGNGHSLVKQAGIKSFGEYLQKRSGSMQAVSASFMNPVRLTKIVLACVVRTPALQGCSMESIFRSAMQAAELGLEPGSALGEAYLVPFKDQCQMIVGYRGLISLAFRSGHISSIQSREVYKDDQFDYEMGLEPRLRHVPSGTSIDAQQITHAYCVIKLKDGGLVYDVMTKAEIDRIRSRSRAGGSGPWVTDYAEMAKKTVTRRALKYAPMSVEMSKALAADVAADTGDNAGLEFEGIIEGEYTVDPGTGEVKEARTNGVDAVKAQLGIDDPPGVETSEGFDRESVIEIAKGLQKQLGMNGQQSSAYNMRTVGKPAYGEMDEADLSKLVDSLQAELDKKAGA